MTADELLLQAIAAGLTSAPDGEQLLIRPKGRVNDELRVAIVAQRGAVLASLLARTSMPAILAPVSPRPCSDFEQLHMDVFCLHFQFPMTEPVRPCRCVAFKQRTPALPWGDE